MLYFNRKISILYFYGMTMVKSIRRSEFEFFIYNNNKDKNIYL